MATKRTLTDKILVAIFAPVAIFFLILAISNSSTRSDWRPGIRDKAAYDDTFEQAGRVGRNLRTGNQVMPSSDALNEEAKRRYPSDDDRQKAWRRGVAAGYESR